MADFPKTKAAAHQAFIQRFPSARDGVEYLNYRLATSFLDTDRSDTSDYFIRLVKGKVDAYGQKGDFETTQRLQERIQIEVINK